MLALLAVVVVAGFGGVERWPLTGWRLYSRLRSERSVDWEAVAVDDRGGETAIDPRDLPLGFRHLPLVLAEFPGLPEADRAEVCEAVVGELRDEGREVVELEISRTIETRRLRDGHVETRRDPDVRFACGGGR